MNGVDAIATALRLLETRLFLISDSYQTNNLLYDTKAKDVN